jgi:hypothetical protein
MEKGTTWEFYLLESKECVLHRVYVLQIALEDCF